MDSKTFMAALSKATGRDTRQVSDIMQHLATVMSTCCGEMDAVAIPSFGTFQPVKSNERVVTDEATGRRVLEPPCISVEFKSSVVLRKSLS